MIEIILGLAILLLLTLLFVSGIAIRNLYNKNQIYEGWVLNLSKRVEDTYQTIKQLDEKQMFESDDEVGIVFQQIKSLIQELNDKIEDDYEE